MDNIDDTENYMIKKTSFHRRCARCITGMHIPKQRDYGQFWNTFDAVAKLFSVSLPNNTSIASVWHLSQVFGIYRKCLASIASVWHPLL
jgi:hypothetical protein